MSDPERNKIIDNAEKMGALFDALRSSYSLAKIEALRAEKNIPKEVIAEAFGLMPDKDSYDSYILYATQLDTGLLMSIPKVAELLGVTPNELKA